MISVDSFHQPSSTTLKQEQLERFVILQTKSAMKRNVLKIPMRMTLRVVGLLFEVYDFNGLPVVEDRHLVGIVTKLALLKTFSLTPHSVVPHYDELMELTAGEIMTRDVYTVHPDTPLTHVLQMMIETANKSFPVVDEKHRLMA